MRDTTDEPVSTNATRASLLGRAVGQDDIAWRQLVDLYGPLIAFWCREYNLDSHALADIMQEVFLSVSKSLHRFRASPGAGAFRSWLWKITRSKLIDAQRKSQRTPTGNGGSTAAQHLASFSDPSSIPEEEPSSVASLNQLRLRALKQIQTEFQPQTWNAFWRTAVDGIPTDIVAKELGISVAGVRQSRSRILRRMRVYLDEEIEDSKSGPDAS